MEQRMLIIGKKEKSALEKGERKEGKGKYILMAKRKFPVGICCIKTCNKCTIYEKPLDFPIFLLYILPNLMLGLLSIFPLANLTIFLFN